MKCVFVVLVAGILFLPGCAPMYTKAERQRLHDGDRLLVARLGGERVSEAAITTMRKHMEASETRGTVPTAIPPSSWTPLVHELHPLRVFHDNYRVAIVLHEDRKTMLGLWVENPISSSVMSSSPGESYEVIWAPSSDDPRAVVLGTVWTFLKMK